MGYFSCSAESAIATCDPRYWDLKNNAKTGRPKPYKPLKIREFSYSDLVSATDGFSAENFLGKGSHGSVYKATLDDGKLIAAVKKTKISIQPLSYCQCTTSPVENEIEILSRIQNQRLVNLIGFCSKKEAKVIVVEFMPNGSLYDLLHSSFRPPGWRRRLRFALQIAMAVQALHSSSPPVIHRDIKSSNVLIDGDFNARLGDFGLALRGHVEDVKVKSTPPAGTLGYLDPGYLSPGDLSAKSDVFSFGILLLEIISGRNPIDLNYSPTSVVDWAIPMIKQGNFAGICDRRVQLPGSMALIRNAATLAAMCVKSKAEKRPAMSEAVEWLEMARKKVREQRQRIWNKIGRRADKSTPLLKREATEETKMPGSEKVATIVKVGSRRNRKVSSVGGGERSGREGDRLVRSRSVGSSAAATAIRRDSAGSLGRREQGIAVKVGAVKLMKSKSMGVSESSSRIVQSGHERRARERERYDYEKEKSEGKFLEEPLISSRQH